MPFSEVFGKFSNQTEQIEFLQTVVDGLPLAVFCKDAQDDMRVVIWNKMAEKIFGPTASEVVGRSATDLFPAEIAKKFFEDDLEVIRGGKPVFVPERSQVNLTTQQVVNFRIWKIPLVMRTGKLVLCIAQDMTQVIRAEEATRERERQLKTISANVPGLLFQFKMSSTGQFSFPFFSKKVSDVLDLKSESIESDASAILSLIFKDDMQSFEESLEKTIKTLAPWNWEGRFWSKTNELRWFQGASSPMKLDDGSIVWDGILFDITAQKQAEEKIRLQEAQLVGGSKLVALGEMAGGVAHEINTPLNAILFCAEQIQCSLRENSFDKRELFEMSELISETAQRIAKIVRGLKAFARDGSTEEPEEIEVESIVEQALSLCGQRMQQNGIRVEFVKPTTAVRVSCRSVQLGQVILNLLNNSFDAVVDTNAAWIKIEVKASKYVASIEVTDSGPGLSSDVKAKLFQPFFTTKQVGKGTGIGLSISRGIMESHEGRLFLDEDSANTKFVIELPMIKPQKAVA